MKRLNVLKSLAVLFVFSLMVWGFIPSEVEGSVPQLINFQGVLKDAAGNPPAVDMLDVTFTIYDDPLGGSALWTETLSITIADEGRFNVLLGSSNPIPDSVFKDTIRYLGIKVDTDPEMLPRQRLASVGYAYRVNSVDGALGGTINGAIDAPGMSSKIRFHYNDVSEFPSAATYHGMFAHAHNQGAAYYAHAAQWVRLADSAHPHSSLAASDLDPNPALSVDADGNVGIGTTSPTKKLDVMGSIKTSDTLFASNVSSNSPLRLQAPAGTTRMFIDDVTGNVGIGTTTPAERLTVKGATSNGGGDIVSFRNGSDVLKSIMTDRGAQRWFLQDSTNAEKGSISYSVPTGVPGIVFFDASGTSRSDFRHVTGGGFALAAGSGSGIPTEWMRLTASGNVGIGITSPGAKLSLGTNGANTKLALWDVPGDQYGFGIQSLQFRLHLGNSNARFSFLNASNGSEIMTLQGNGNLGIGTSSPVGKLHVNAIVSSTSASFFEATDISAAGGFLRLKDGTITASHYMPMIHGKGVGTGVDRTGLLLMGEPGEDGSDDGAVRIDGRLNGVSLVNSPVLRVTNNVSELFRIAANGNVGIGTASPGASNLLELSSTTKGFVLPRMTKTERDAIASPVAGMMVYQTDNTPGLRVYNGTNWMRFTETAD